jgi:hypothetical protein
VTFLLVVKELPSELQWLSWLPRGAQFALLAVVFWWQRRGRTLLPTNAAERQLWAIWIGYMLAYEICVVICSELINHGLRIPGMRHGEELLRYPFAAALSGLALFVMGSSYWGRCYAVGTMFFVVAALMPMHMDWAPLEFGAMWGFTLFAIGVHLRRVGQQAAAEAGKQGAG